MLTTGKCMTYIKAIYQKSEGFENTEITVEQKSSLEPET